MVVVTKGSGRWMILVLAGDAFWALNFGGSLLLGGDALKSRVQLGDNVSHGPEKQEAPDQRGLPA